MKKIGISLFLAVGVIGVFSLVALAKSDKASAQSDVAQDKGKVETVEAELVEETGSQNGNLIQTQTKNAGEEKNLKNEIKNSEDGMMEDDETSDKNKENGVEKIKDSAEKMVKKLKEIAEQEPKIEAALTKLAQKQDEIQEEVVGFMEKIENKNKIKTFLLGTDYKNLGQLRSSMVQNRNQIKELIQLTNQAEGTETKLALQEQLKTMLQEREDIDALIKADEDSFSLFGWAFKLMNGYSDGAVDAEAEAELETEVQEALIVAVDETTVDVEIVK